MNKYKISEVSRFREDFRRYFPDIRQQDIRYSLMTLINRYITIDMERFGAELERIYPEDWGRLSITEIVIKHYGKEADNFLNAII